MTNEESIPHDVECEHEFGSSWGSTDLFKGSRWHKLNYYSFYLLFTGCLPCTMAQYTAAVECQGTGKITLQIMRQPPSLVSHGC